jgi:bifunctional non-homologous end joining protein LigD
VLTILPPIVPMEPVPTGRPFQDERFLYQVKWDGVRVLAYKERNRVRLLNRKGNDRTLHYPELHVISAQTASAVLVLDGEVVALDETGKPNFWQVLKRDLSPPGKQTPVLPKKIPVVYFVFDVLYRNNVSLISLPLWKRQEILAEELHDADTVRVCENYSDGLLLFRAVEKMGLEGVVAKERQGLYHPGRKHPTWQKIKCFRRLDAVVGGVRMDGKQARSLLLGIYQDHGLVYIGRAGSGLTGEHIRFLAEQVPFLRVHRAPFVNPPPVWRETVHWLQPCLTVHVAFQDWTPEGTMRSPVIEAFHRGNRPH